MTTSTTKEQYYKFIRPRNLRPQEPKVAVGRESALACVKWIVNTEPKTVHYDLETTGLVFSDPKQIITNVGLASELWCVGIDLIDLTFEEQKPLWDWLRQQKLGGFNLGFDLSWPWRQDLGNGKVDPCVDGLTVASDTSLWFRLLATEAHIRQRFDLGTLTADILGWPASYQQKGWLRSKLEQYQVKKDDMWKLALAEPEGYTIYCALDAEASYQADIVFAETRAEWEFEGLTRYHDAILVPKIKRNIKAACSGIPIDKEKLATNTEKVKRRMLRLEAEILNHPRIREAEKVWTENQLLQTYKLRPTLSKEWAKKEDKPWLHPDTYRIHIPANPDKLPEWLKEFGGKFYKPVTKFEVSGKNKEWPRFNFNSVATMKWLIYDLWLDNKRSLWYRNQDRPEYGGLVTVNVEGKDYTIDLTKTGGLPTGGDILSIFGDLGALINEYKGLQKLLGDFLIKYSDASNRDGSIHPQSKVLGTITGRMSGGN